MTEKSRSAKTFRVLPDGRYDIGFGQLCTTNPELIQLTVANVVEFYGNHLEYSYLSLSPEDYLRDWCQCANCLNEDTGEIFRKATTKDKYMELPVVADRLWMLLNPVGEALEKQYPDKYIYCFGCISGALRTAPRGTRSGDRPQLAKNK